MKIYTRIVLDMITGELLATNSRLYFGPVAVCKGASQQQNDLAASQAALNQTLISNYSTQFANQQAIFAAIKSVYDPIFAAGPNQYGFSQAEDTALRTQATEGTAANYRQAEKATASQLASAGGGNNVLPSGVAADIDARVKGAAAGQESSQNLGITTAGYAAGKENFQNASNAEFGVASGENPLGYAGAAINSGKAAFDEATTIQQANAAASPWGAIGGMIGGVAGAFAGNPGLGASIGGFLGNAGSSNKGMPSSSSGYDPTFGMPYGG